MMQVDYFDIYALDDDGSLVVEPSATLQQLSPRQRVKTVRKYIRRLRQDLVREELGVHERTRIAARLAQARRFVEESAPGRPGSGIKQAVERLFDRVPNQARRVDR